MFHDLGDNVASVLTETVLRDDYLQTKPINIRMVRKRRVLSPRS